MEQFIASAGSRETSVEIMEAISAIANSEEDAVRIWEDPTQEELAAILVCVTKNGSLSADYFYWGAEGNDWATVEVEPARN